MKLKLIFALLAASLLGSSSTFAQSAADTTTNAFTVLIAKVKDDIKSGKHTEAALADDLKQFDDLLAAENGKPTEMGANILFMKAMLYAQVFESPEKAKPYLEKIKSDYPASTIAPKIDRILKMMDAQAEAGKKQADLVAGKTFPDFDEKDLNGAPLSVAMYKGKVVMVDFWATWCGPCRAELPNVVATYGKYHDKGFEIIGVSLDKTEDLDKLKGFLKDNNMTWSQYFDGQVWQNKLADKYGIQSIPATILIDGQGKIIGRDLRGDDLTQAVAAAVAAK